MVGMSDYVMQGLVMEGETTQESEKGTVNGGDKGTGKDKGHKGRGLIYDCAKTQHISMTIQIRPGPLKWAELRIRACLTVTLYT